VSGEKIPMPARADDSVVGSVDHAPSDPSALMTARSMVPRAVQSFLAFPPPYPPKT